MCARANTSCARARATARDRPIGAPGRAGAIETGCPSATAFTTEKIELIVDDLPLPGLAMRRAHPFPICAGTALAPCSYPRVLRPPASKKHSATQAGAAGRESPYTHWQQQR